jgi:hypothetical protein
MMMILSRPEQTKGVVVPKQEQSRFGNEKGYCLLNTTRVQSGTIHRYGNHLEWSGATVAVLMSQNLLTDDVRVLRARRNWARRGYMRV